MQTTGYILDEDVQNVVNRIDIVAEIGEHIKLTKKGRYFWGLCPFHEEKTPSFKVDPGLQLYYCFGCHEGGNTFTFISKTQNLSFIEAIEHFAEKLGIKLTRTGSNKSYNLKERLHKANDEARKLYCSHLFSEKGKFALDYLKKRGFSIDVIKGFELGLSPRASASIVNALSKKGFSADEIIAAGLAKKVSSRFGTDVKDFFADRLMFPIRDIQGRVVAFGGRIWHEGQNGGSGYNPKYLNSAETQIFRKNSMLYALNEAKKAIAQTNTAIIVEGYTDVIALHQAGIKNAVATLGTALTINHLQLVNRFADRIVLVFDGDAAGFSAAERVINLGADTQNIYVLSLPEGNDPADYIRSNGEQGFLSLADKAILLTEFCIDMIISRFDVKNYQSKIKAARAAIKLLHQLKDPLILSENRKLLSEKLDIDEKSITLLIPKKDNADKRINPDLLPSVDAGEKAQREVIKLLLQKETFMDYLDFLEEEDFPDEKYRNIFSVLKSAGQGKKINEMINKIKDRDLQNSIVELAVEKIKASENNLEAYIFALYNKLKELGLERKINDLKRMLQKMNPLKDMEYNKIFEQLITLEAQKRDFSVKNIGG